MADVEISYRGSTIASLSASGTKTLQTQGKYCDDDITVEYTSPGGGSLPDLGTKNGMTLGGLLHALSTGDYHTGTFTVTSYFPANQESEILDTGYPDNVAIIVIFDTSSNPYEVNTERLMESVGFFTAAENPGDDQVVRGAYCFMRRQGGAETAMFGGRANSYRVANGKLYMNPKFAQTNYTYFILNKTYRWIAVPWL